MTRAWREQWEKDGYLVVPGVFDPVRTARLREIAADIWAQFCRQDALSGKPGGDADDPHCMRHIIHPDYFGTRPSADFAAVMDAVADDLILGIARAILGEAALFRCTTLWHQPVRRREDGNWHRDLQFLHPREDAERRALASAQTDDWESIQLQVPLIPSADIEYVPGSHRRWDTPEEYAIRCADRRRRACSNAMPGAMRLDLQPGDAALFNPNGLHRGRYRADIPRLTLMLTYTNSAGALTDYFSNQPWFLAPGYLAGLSPRTRAFFEPFIAKFQPQWIAGEPALEGRY